jgi:mRNA interferase RelE/StbE
MRDMRRLDRSTRERIFNALDRLAAGDRSLDVRRLSGREEHRLRVGDWRILFERDPKTRSIAIVRVLPRGRAYDR